MGLLLLSRRWSEEERGEERKPGIIIRLDRKKEGNNYPWGVLGALDTVPDTSTDSAHSE